MSRIFKDAISVGKAIAAQIRAGCPMASQSEQLERHKICQSCDQLNVEEYRCNVCNCFLQLKVPLRTSVCPKGKWADLMKDEIKDE